MGTSQFSRFFLKSRRTYSMPASVFHRHIVNFSPVLQVDATRGLCTPLINQKVSTCTEPSKPLSLVSVQCNLCYTFRRYLGLTRFASVSSEKVFPVENRKFCSRIEIKGKTPHQAFKKRDYSSGSVGGSYIKMNSMSSKSFLVPYHPPTWATQLKSAPNQKVQLAVLPTPIHRWFLPGLPEDVEVFIKRDDMSGSTLSGNKVRKLEFLLADAIVKGCTHVVTCGGIQSNHCRSTAIAATQLGLTPHLLLRTDIQDAGELGGVGNVLLDQLSGAKLYLVPHHSPHNSHLIPRMQALASTIRRQAGEECYVIPVGGTDNVGVWGYINGFSELLRQGVAEKFDDIAFACGSGGTAEGLALGNYLSQSNLKIHGLAVSDDKKYFDQHLNTMLSHFEMDKDTEAGEILDIIEEPKGLGYGLSTDEELDFAIEVARRTGIMLDPVYTGKAVRGLVKELQDNPGRFKGKRILYIHTGGVFGMYDGRLEQRLKSDLTAQNNIYVWRNVSDECPYDEV